MKIFCEECDEIPNNVGIEKISGGIVIECKVCGSVEIWRNSPKP